MTTLFLIAILVALIGGFIILGKSIKDYSAAKKDDQSLLLIHSQMEAISKRISDELDKTKKEIREGSEKATGNIHQQVESFTKNITEMKSALEKVNESVKGSTEKMVSFQDIFKAPQLRGPWGESFLEDILKGRYPEEMILKQHIFQNGEKVDFALKLPNNLLLPIDSKFTRISFEGLMVVPNEVERHRELARAVKLQIDSISQKYLRPEEGTTNFALMFIPAEAIYYEIMFGMRDFNLSEYAANKSIVIVSPNTIYLTLNVCENWLRDVAVHKETRELIKKLGTIKLDSQKLDDSFNKLGKHLFSAQSSFEDSHKRLDLLTERVDKVIKIGSKKEEEKPVALLEQPLDFDEEV